MLGTAKIMRQTLSLIGCIETTVSHASGRGPDIEDDPTTTKGWERDFLIVPNNFSAVLFHFFCKKNSQFYIGR